MLPCPSGKGQTTWEILSHSDQINAGNPSRPNAKNNTCSPTRRRNSWTGPSSTVDPDMASRLLQCRAPIWDREKEASDAKPGRRTPILALVAYHGKKRWTAPLSLPGMMTADPALHDMTGGDTALHGMMGEDLALRDQICGTGYSLLDNGRMPEEQLGSDPDLKGGLLVLKHAYRSPVDSRVLHRVRELISAGTRFERQTYQWILDALDTDLDTVLAAFETKGAKTVGVLVNSVIGRVRAVGAARGEARGEILGRASILNRLLERRFGRLPATVRERVRTASVQDLDAWGDAALDAPTLEAVFEERTGTDRGRAARRRACFRGSLLGAWASRYRASLPQLAPSLVGPSHSSTQRGRGTTHARELLIVAERDVTALRGTANPATIADELLGFLVQRAAEKLLKAWLTTLGETYPLSHDLAALLDLLGTHGAEVARYTGLVNYSRFVVRLRCSTANPGTEPLDRGQSVREVVSLLKVVRQVLMRAEHS